VLYDHRDWTTPIKLLSFHDAVAGMNNSGDKSQKSETNVDEKIATTTPCEQDTKWWENHGADKETTVRTSHLSSGVELVLV